MSTNVLNPTFAPAKTISSQRQRFDFTPNGGSVVQISCKMIDVEKKMATTVLQQPGADDVNRDVAEVIVSSESTITLVDIEEIEVVTDLLGGVNGLVFGTGIAYVKDPRDTTGTVKASITNQTGTAFDCSVRRPDAAIRIGGKDFSKTSLLIRNLSGADLKWNKAATAPDVAP